MDLNGRDDFTEITDKDFDVPSYLSKLNHPGCGGTAVFIGTSRNTSKMSNLEVVALDYQAYLPMANKKFKEISNTLREKYCVGRIVLVHRVGFVPIGEPGLFVGVCAPHRQEAIQCMDQAITDIKSCLPVWKQEVYCDGSRAWTANKECFWSAESRKES